MCKGKPYFFAVARRAPRVAESAGKQASTRLPTPVLERLPATSFQAFLQNVEAGPRDVPFSLETYANRDSSPRRAGGGREARSSEPRTRESSCFRSHECAEAQRDVQDRHANAPR